MTHLTEEEAAMLAAQNTAMATASLLDFAREGEAQPGHAFQTPDTCELLADALRTAIQIDVDRQRQAFPGNTRIELQTDVVTVLDRFLEGWA